MKQTALTLITLALAMAAAAQSGPRQKVSLNFDWAFHAGDTPNAAAPETDTRDWQTVNLPHDFQISQPWVAPDKAEKADNSDQAANVKSRLSARAFKEMGTGWYRRVITPDPSWRGRHITLDFGGIMLTGDVYLNGQRIGGTDYGYLGFETDITKLLDYGHPNILAVKADTGEPNNSRWYTGGGLFRDVNLIITDEALRFTRHPICVTTPDVSADRATVKIEATLACALNDKDIRLVTRITAPDGTTLRTDTVSRQFRRAQRTNTYLADSFAVSSPRLWSCESPQLYTAHVSILRQDGTEADLVSQTFGIRKIEFSPEFGFKLNGKKVILKGIANHHTLGALGAAAYPRAIEKRLQLLRSFGFNHIRTSHNPYSEDFLDLCDRYGFLVVDELYDKWLTQYAGGRKPWTELWQHDVPEFVQRDRNHPSVIVWSLGNELQTYWSLPFADWGVTPYRLQKTLLRRYDTTRPITVAMHPRGRSQETDSLPAPLVHETDIAAYNYRYMYFPGDSRRFPNLMFYQSEANTAMMGPNYFDMDLDKVLGLAYWGMIDYLGESNGWPAKGWTNGVFDISLNPKPNAYFLKSIFQEDQPLVHIGIIDSDDNTVWNDVRVGTQGLSDHWNRRPGSTLDLYTYTNADEVELTVNGRSLGRKANNRADSKARNRIKWTNIAYEPGRIEAIARTAGKIVARHKIETTGEATRLTAEGDRTDWRADGTDLLHVAVSAVDKKGRRVQTAADKLTFKVEGPADIVGVINGDITSPELTVGDTRSLYRGTATVILRSRREAGTVTLTATTAKLKTAKLTTATK